MEANSPGRNAKTSVYALAACAAIAIVPAIFLVGRSPISGTALHRAAGVCKVAAGACAAKFSPVSQYLIWSKTLLLAFCLLAFGFSLIKSASVLYFAHRARRFEACRTDVPLRVLRIAGEIGASVPIQYFVSEKPFAFTKGIFRTTIHISSAVVDSLDDARLKALIAHEFAHVVKRDNFAIFAALALRDFLFILPVSHFLFGIFMRQKEFAADEFAVRLTGDPLGLAEAIVSVARLNAKGRPAHPAYATFFSGESGARERVERLLGKNTPTQFHKGKAFAALFASVLILSVFAGIALAQPRISTERGQCSGRVDCARVSGACCIK